MLEPLVYFIFWGTIAAYSTTTSPGSMAVYFFFYAIIFRITGTWIAEDLKKHIQAGTLGPMLLHPFPGSFIASQVLFETNLKKVRILATLPFAALLLIFFSQQLTIALPGWEQLVYLPLALLCAAILHFCFWLCIISIAFWTYHIDGIVEFVDSFIPFADGSVIPAVFLTGFISNIFKLLPFRYMLSFPLEIMSFPMTASALAHGTIMMLSWTVVFLF